MIFKPSDIRPLLKTFLYDVITAIFIFVSLVPPVFAETKNTTVINLNEGKSGDSADTGSTQINQLLGSKNEANKFVPTIRVHAVGNIPSQGVYDVKLSTRAAEVIQLAAGNLNKVRLYQIRGSNGDKYYDLYQYRFHGDLSQSPYLQDGDVIYIPKSRGAVRIEGPVARPGVYELAWEKNLYQIINLAGGFTDAMSKMYPVKVVRFSDAGERFVIDVVQIKTSLEKFEIKRGDNIIVPDVVNASSKFDYTVDTIPGENLVYPTSIAEVFVTGAVTKSGPIPYRSFMTIKDYIGYAGPVSDTRLSRVSVYRDGKNRHLKLSDKAQAGDVIFVKARTSTEILKYIGISSTVLSVVLSAILIRETVKD